MLMEIFEVYRETVREFAGLDPIHYLSAPSLTLDAFLKTSGESLELLTSREMYRMIEEGQRGGVAYTSLRHAEADEEHQIFYTDGKPMFYLEDTVMALSPFLFFLLLANNLYGSSQSQPLPYKDFRFMSREDIDNIDWLGHDFTQEMGESYIAEVDVSFPSHIHRSMAEYPLLPENITITGEDISPYTKHCLEEQGMSSKLKEKRLTSTLHCRTRYVVHGRVLAYALKKGVKLDKVHRCIAFTQKSFARDYIHK